MSVFATFRKRIAQGLPGTVNSASGNPTGHRDEPPALTAGDPASHQRMAKAIRDDELHLFFLPQVNIRRHVVTGVEALLRWPIGTEQFIAPRIFIPVAEAAGQMPLLTRWVVHAGLQHLAKWHASALPIGLAINILRSDVLDANFPEYLRDQLAANALRPDTLTLELSTPSIVAAPDLVADGLHRLRAIGVLLALDNFSVTDGKFPLLRELPVNSLKVDHNFVMGMARRPEDARLVRSSIRLAHRMRVSATAPGVYSKRILNQLTEFGCDDAQGFHISPPQSSADVTRWLEETHTLVLKGARIRAPVRASGAQCVHLV